MLAHRVAASPKSDCGAKDDRFHGIRFLGQRASGSNKCEVCSLMECLRGGRAMDFPMLLKGSLTQPEYSKNGRNLE